MKKITAGRKGLITVIVMIILSLVFFYVLKQPIDSSYQNIIYCVYAIGILWSLIDYGRTATSATKFNEYFSEGFKTFIMVTFLMVIYTLIIYLCNPQIKEAKLALNNQMVLQQGDHTPMEIAENAAQLRSIFIPMTLAVYTFVYLVMGALITTISSAVIGQMKKM
ncbi:MAG TPA: hypothetical protein VK559_06515 [Ferruginibacter sp.]|nr:hypothetical protein [Ferruginibacter sp.]